MSWWTTIKDSAVSVGAGIAGGGQSLWNNPSIQGIGTSLVQFITNTSFHILGQGRALGTAIPALITHEGTNRIAKELGSILWYDVLPVVTINVLNNTTQNYFKNEDNQHPNSYGYFVWYPIATTVNYLVTAYTWKRGVETAIRLTVIESAAPSAFLSATPSVYAPITYCGPEREQCNLPRRLKGAVREQAMLLANEVVISGIGALPYGSPLAQVLTIENVGRYITRTVTPYRCERHKYMQQEFVLALGLTYMLNSWLLTNLLESKFGPLPTLYGRALQHILLMAHVNIAAHMPIPLVEERSATLFDFFHYYESASRFIIDVLWAGLFKRIPVVFKPRPGEKSSIPLSSALRLGTRVFQSDLEREPTTFITHPVVKRLKDLAIPRMLRSTYNFTEDRIVSVYWHDICEGTIIILADVEKQRSNAALIVKAITFNSTTATAVARVLDYTVGVPTQLTELVLLLSEEKAFWDLIRTMRLWFERHHAHATVVAPPTTVTLRALPSGAPPPAPPSITGTTEIVSSAQLTGAGPEASSTIAADRIVTQRRNRAADPYSLFSTRGRSNASTGGAEPASRPSTAAPGF